MATSEIEKLERRYADNPHGLTFAPLAEVHRKNGDIARALELLTAGLELHPNYIPASIVLGRCHQDLGDLPAAEAAFAHVLRLDDENVIALKSLADINERLEHFGEAENWLRRLVAVDRSNDEAREQLQRLEARKKEANPEPAVAAAATLEVIDLEPEVSPADVLPVDLAALELSRPTSENADSPAEVAASPAPRHDVAAVTDESQAPAAAASEPAEPARAGDAVQPVSGLISAEFQPPLQAIGGLGVETSEDLVLDVSGNTEFRVPDASEDLKALAERMSAPPEPGPAQRPEPAPRVVESVSPPLAEPKPAAEPPPMKVLPVGMPVTRRSYLARETKGRSVASFFHSLLAARPPAEEGRNNDAGGSGSTGDDSLLAPPAVPAADQKDDGAVSFDDFFGAEREGSAPLRQRADPGKDDLDQFQTWLQNLKR
ncbi:MAG TPA: tetratricopeptide repeat protein [Gemmatimonadales bacterium]|nr:tetratricopeptide repeat protein [Gemmatimonadales bacterium]